MISSRGIPQDSTACPRQFERMLEEPRRMDLRKNHRHLQRAWCLEIYLATALIALRAYLEVVLRAANCESSAFQPAPSALISETLLASRWPRSWITVCS